MTDTPPPPESDVPASWEEDDDDALRSDRKSRSWWIIGGAAVVVLVVIAAFAVVNLRKDANRAWPADVGGRPQGLGSENQAAAEVTPSADPGVYVWNSFDGWHLWVVSGDGLDGVSGTITSDKAFTSATSSAPDAGSVTAKDATVTFDLKPGEAIGGVDFEPGFYAKKLTFDLKTEAGPVPASMVFQGSGRTPAGAVPLVLEKTSTD